MKRPAIDFSGERRGPPTRWRYEQSADMRKQGSSRRGTRLSLLAARVKSSAFLPSVDLVVVWWFAAFAASAGLILLSLLT